jgi:putative CocE/NonD family hydrolase
MSLHVETLGPAPHPNGAEEVLVRMRDGVRLATDVYLPDDTTPGPAVLVRLPYDKCGRYTFMPQAAPYFTSRGYAFVVQDVRGKFRSGGETMPGVHEVADGYDTLDWVASQPWCDGSVGMFGDSYYGATQWAAVASGHPALRAIVPRMTSVNLAQPDGAERGGEVASLWGADYLAHYWLDQFIYTYEVDWARRPLAEVFDDAFAVIGTRCAAFDAMLRASADSHAARPSGRWQHPFDVLRVPVLQSVGWFDSIAPGQMRDYRTLAARPATAGLQFLIADSTDHENYHLSDVPITPETDHDGDDAALQRLLPRYLGPGLDFFDRTLRDHGKLADLPRVRWHLGHDDWHDAPSWPPPGSRELHLYLTGTRATADAEGGALAGRPDSASAPVRWTHDPDNLVPSTVFMSTERLREFADEQAVQSRPDVLTFTAEARDRPLDLAGPVRVRAHVGTTGPSMQLHAKLTDVASDGSARMLLSGETYLDNPDPAQAAEIDLGHVGYRLEPGHRLRVHLASSDYPHGIWHPGTSENPWQAVRGVRNEQTLVTGGPAPSHLSITVLGDE